MHNTYSLISIRLYAYMYIYFSYHTMQACYISPCMRKNALFTPIAIPCTFTHIHTHTHSLFSLSCIHVHACTSHLHAYTCTLETHRNLHVGSQGEYNNHSRHSHGNHGNCDWVEIKVLRSNTKTCRGMVRGRRQSFAFGTGSSSELVTHHSYLAHVRTR